MINTEEIVIVNTAGVLVLLVSLLSRIDNRKNRHLSDHLFDTMIGITLGALVAETASFLLDGVPMLYNGQEIADAAPLLQKFSPFRGGCLGKTLFGWPSTCPKKRLRSPFLGAIPSHYRQMDLKFVRNEKKLRRCRWEGGGHRRSCG